MDRRADDDRVIDKNVIPAKKIAIRFIKEMGLFKAWKEYIKSDKFYINIWNDCKFTKIDEIFGYTNFTLYLHNKHKMNFNSTITYIFRYYLSVLKFPPARFNADIDKAKEDVFIDENGKITKYAWDYE